MKTSSQFSGGACPTFLAVVAMIALATVTALAGEDAAPKPKEQSLDEQLLDNLNNELLDGLETLPTDEAKTEEMDAAGQGDATSAPDEDTFTRISKRMHEAEKLIPKTESAKTTRKVQREIVTDLDKLIDQLEKQCQKCQGGASGNKQSQQTAQRESVKQPGQAPKDGEGEQNPNKPARDSTQKLGKDEVKKADMEQMKSLLKDLWGQLPAKAREQMLQSSPEQFLPKYELLIEDYYKRLAEKQGTGR